MCHSITRLERHSPVRATDLRRSLCTSITLLSDCSLGILCNGIRSHWNREHTLCMLQLLQNTRRPQLLPQSCSYTSSTSMMPSTPTKKILSSWKEAPAERSDNQIQLSYSIHLRDGLNPILNEKRIFFLSSSSPWILPPPTLTSSGVLSSVAIRQKSRRPAFGCRHNRNVMTEKEPIL